LPLFTQSVLDNSRISEGYDNPEEALNQSAAIKTPELTNTQRAATRHGLHSEVWVSDVSTVLYDDTDHDGYFSGFSVSLDVDVTEDSAAVYADIYLQSSGSVPELFHTTNVFSVYEQESFDRYRVDVNLTDNIHAGDYDLLIEVVNAHSLEIEDTVSYLTHSNLSHLPLEASSFSHEHGFNDTYNDPYYDSSYEHNHSNTVVSTFSVGLSSGSIFHAGNASSSGVGFGVSASVTEFHGGAGWGILLLLAAAGVVRKSSRNAPK